MSAKAYKRNPSDSNLDEIIKLQLRKPKNWNWTLSTSKSSPQIAMPTIQLFNSKGVLLIETADNGDQNKTWQSTDDQFCIRSKSADKATPQVSDKIKENYHSKERREPSSEMRKGYIRSSSVGTHSHFHRNDGRSYGDRSHIHEEVKRRTLDTRCRPYSSRYYTPITHLERSKSDVLQRYLNRKEQTKTERKPRLMYYEKPNIEEIKKRIKENTEQKKELKKSRSEILSKKKEEFSTIKNNFNNRASLPLSLQFTEKRLQSNDPFQRKMKYTEASAKRAIEDGYSKFITPHLFNSRSMHNMICRRNTVANPQHDTKKEDESSESDRWTTRTSCAGTLVVPEDDVPDETKYRRRRRDRRSEPARSSTITSFLQSCCSHTENADNNSRSRCKEGRGELIKSSTVSCFDNEANSIGISGHRRRNHKSKRPRKSRSISRLEQNYTTMLKDDKPQQDYKKKKMRGHQRYRSDPGGIQIFRKDKDSDTSEEDDQLLEIIHRRILRESLINKIVKMGQMDHNNEENTTPVTDKMRRESRRKRGYSRYIDFQEFHPDKLDTSKDLHQEEVDSEKVVDKVNEDTLKSAVVKGNKEVEKPYSGTDRIVYLRNDSNVDQYKNTEATTKDEQLMNEQEKMQKQIAYLNGAKTTDEVKYTKERISYEKKEDEQQEEDRQTKNTTETHKSTENTNPERLYAEKKIKEDEWNAIVSHDKQREDSRKASQENENSDEDEYTEEEVEYEEEEEETSSQIKVSAREDPEKIQQKIYGEDESEYTEEEVEYEDTEVRDMSKASFRGENEDQNKVIPQKINIHDESEYTEEEVKYRKEEEEDKTKALTYRENEDQNTVQPKTDIDEENEYTEEEVETEDESEEDLDEEGEEQDKQVQIHQNQCNRSNDLKDKVNQSKVRFESHVKDEEDALRKEMPKAKQDNIDKMGNNAVIHENNREEIETEDEEKEEEEEEEDDVEEEEEDVEEEEEEVEEEEVEEDEEEEEEIEEMDEEDSKAHKSLDEVGENGWEESISRKDSVSNKYASKLKHLADNYAKNDIDVLNLKTSFSANESSVLDKRTKWQTNDPRKSASRLDDVGSVFGKSDENCNYIVQQSSHPGRQDAVSITNQPPPPSAIATELDRKAKRKDHRERQGKYDKRTANATAEAEAATTEEHLERQHDTNKGRTLKHSTASSITNDAQAGGCHPKEEEAAAGDTAKHHQDQEDHEKKPPEHDANVHHDRHQNHDEYGDSEGHDPSRMGANVSRHSAKGLHGRRTQSSGNICSGGKGRRSSGDGGGGKGVCGSLPNYLEDKDSRTATSYNNNHHQGSCGKQEDARVLALGEAAPLHWKFSDTQTNLCDQGYGSERSPEEEQPPAPLGHQNLESYEQCHRHLDPYSCYPFITPDSTFAVSLIKGSRGLGLSVTGGTDSGGSWPGLIRIKRLFPLQPAAACGQLNIGDLLLEVNGISLIGLTNYEALEVLRTTPNHVELRVCRPPADVLNCVSPISEVPPPPPRREPPSSLNLSPPPSQFLPDDEMYTGQFDITMAKIQGSLGFTLRKEDDSALGHYVRALVREPALSDGRIRPGDKIIAVNDVEISSMTHEQAVQFLRQAGDVVKLRLYRDSAQTPVSTLSPSETTPRTSFIKKAHLRQEAVDMLNDIAMRKISSQDIYSLSPSSSPRRIRRQVFPSDASQITDPADRYIADDEQFHEAFLKKSNKLEDDPFSSLFSNECDKPSRPNSLDLGNSKGTPVITRKPKFNFSLAHNAYELNNLDADILDAPNLAYTLKKDDVEGAEVESTDSFPQEPASMPHIPIDNPGFSHKNPAYQSAHPPCGTDIPSGDQERESKKPDGSNMQKWKGVVFDADGEGKRENENVQKSEEIMEGDIEQILAIELTRGWNSRLGFSLQGAAGYTYVSAVHPNSVAAKDGRLKPGDRVIKVNDESVEHMSTSEIIDLLRIVRGPVCIVVSRKKSKQDCKNRSNAEN